MINEKRVDIPLILEKRIWCKNFKSYLSQDFVEYSQTEPHESDIGKHHHVGNGFAHMKLSDEHGRLEAQPCVTVDSAGSNNCSFF